MLYIYLLGIREGNAFLMVYSITHRRTFDYCIGLYDAIKTIKADETYVTGHLVTFSYFTLKSCDVFTSILFQFLPFFYNMFLVEFCSYNIFLIRS